MGDVSFLGSRKGSVGAPARARDGGASGTAQNPTGASEERAAGTYPHSVTSNIPSSADPFLKVDVKNSEIETEEHLK